MKMLYGILLESCRDGISTAFGQQIWKRVVQDLGLEHETFTIHGRYEENLIERIAESLSDITREGSPEFYMELFGECFVRFFTTYGYDKILRVAGRRFRDFLHAIDQLHDSTRFSFPRMKSPLFSVAEEDERGAILMYKSRRRGFQHYVVGQLRECAKNFYDEKIYVTVAEDLSTNEYTRIMFRVDFNNEAIKETTFRLMRQATLPNITTSTFFKVFPFCVVINPEMKVSAMGPSLESLFCENSIVIGKHISDVFTLLRPDILHIEWEKFVLYGQSVVFIMESRVPLKVGLNKIAPNIAVTEQNENSANSTSVNSMSIRLKGQIKYIPSWHKIAFLCHPVLNTTEEMLSVGLFLNDLNFYDGSSEILISGIQHARHLQAAIDKQHAWVTKLQHSKSELQEIRRKGKRLLYSMMPRHIAHMLQQGVPANSICESHKLLTVLFAYSIDIKDIIQKLAPQQIVDCINRTVDGFDNCAEKFDVFKVETKADLSYLVVAGIQDRSIHSDRRTSNTSINTNYSSSSAGDEYNTSHRRPSTIRNHDHEIEEEHQNTIDLNFIPTNLKNVYNLNQAEVICALALELMKCGQTVINPLTKQPFRMKFGFHSGPAVGGIVGNRNYQYCLFGDTINTASRITTYSEIGKIHFSATSYELLKDSLYFETAYREKIEMRGKGSMDTYWLVGPTEIYLSVVEPAHNRSATVSDHLTSNKEESLTFPSNINDTSPILKVPNLTNDVRDLNGTTSPTRNNVLNKTKEKPMTCPFSRPPLM